jgi:simple sugar transport system permease protein
MFNAIAGSLLIYFLGQVLNPEGLQESATANFPEATHLPTLHDILGVFGISWSKHAPANVTLLVAIAACFAVWALIWKTRIGYQIRSFGLSESAAKYAGINPTKIIMITMLISGALAGMMSVNQTMGEAERLVLNAPGGAGFIGIAVALMGRNHPFGIFLAALLFGFLNQGGYELDYLTNIPVQIITIIQALVIMFTGALDDMVRMPLEKLFLSLRAPRAKANQAAE